ncbi:MAG: transcription elongation factor Spt5 [Candidatus Methanomethylophilaceae archaeon]|jgi:transcriptional antiterminator NusG
MSDNMADGAVLNGESGQKDVHTGGLVSWEFQLSADSNEAKLFLEITTGPDADSAPEWDVTLKSSNEELWNNSRSKREVDVDLPGNKAKILKIEVICPKGARYDDEVVIGVSTGSSSLSFTAVAKQSIMVLKTQIDQEKSVADSLMSKANLGEKDIYAIFAPAGLRGYIFVEGMNTDRLREKTRDIKKARSFVDGETSIEEISHYLVPVSAVVGIVEGDLVELVNGPFKGEIARVQQIDQSKEEITVELVEAMVPIPVTVKGDSVRLMEKER